MTTILILLGIFTAGIIIAVLAALLVDWMADGPSLAASQLALLTLMAVSVVSWISLGWAVFG